MRRHFPEDAIYRVDHWLGLDPLNDVLVARFANSMIEPLLNRDDVESVQITMAEAFDVADRGRFYDGAGAIRDVVQNHMLQVLATVLADPPDGSGPDSWLDAKARVIAALRPLTPADAVRGQYDGYREVGFRPVPFNVFGVDNKIANSLRFRISPETEIRLTLAGKRPGTSREAEPQDLVFAKHPGSDMRPYDRLISAALDGKRVLFARQDTVEAAWRLVDPVLDGAVPVLRYARGTWGPKKADGLLFDGDEWHDPHQPI